MKLVFATNNEHKLREISYILNNKFQILCLKDIGCLEDIPENEPTIEGNATAKSMYVFEKFGYDCFADDTGLEVFELNGEPGVHSARYAGEHRSNKDNIAKLLARLNGSNNRKAQFKTVISLLIGGKEFQFPGIVKGTIIETMKGTNGFGYDPVFVPDGYAQTYAEMSEELKNKISHRALATQQLIDFLKTL